MKDNLVLCDYDTGAGPCRTEATAAQGLAITSASAGRIVDLCDEHAQMLSTVLQPFLAHARPLDAKSRSRAPRQSAGPTTAEVRAWARIKGRDVSATGRLPQSFFDEYVAETCTDRKTT